MIIGVGLSLIIIGLWLYAGALSYAYYSTTTKNHYRYKNIYTVSVLTITQSILGIYYILTGDDYLNPARWIAFTLIEYQFLGFLLRGTSKRQFELILTSMYSVLLLLSTLYLSVWFNIAIAAILVCIAYHSHEPIVKKWFTPAMIIYAFTSIIPAIVGFTTNESLLVGVLFSISFVYGAKKLYDKEHINDKLKEMIIDGEL